MSSYLMAASLVVFLYTDWDENDPTFVKWREYCTAYVTAQQLEEETLYGASESELRIWHCTQQTDANGVDKPRG
jgi:hypothetical protein